MSGRRNASSIGLAGSKGRWPNFTFAKGPCCLRGTHAHAEGQRGATGCSAIDRMHMKADSLSVSLHHLLQPCSRRSNSRAGSSGLGEAEEEGQEPELPQTRTQWATNGRRRGKSRDAKDRAAAEAEKAKAKERAEAEDGLVKYAPILTPTGALVLAGLVPDAPKTVILHRPVPFVIATMMTFQAQSPLLCTCAQ